MTGQDWMTKDFYAALGVAKDADEQTLKKAHRKLAKQYHPDRNPGDKAAADKMREVNEAFDILSDKEKRQQYDAIRAMGTGGPRFTPGSGGGAGFEDVFGGMFGGGGMPGGGTYTSNMGGGDINDILSQMMGGGGMGGGGFGSRFRRAQKGADIAAAYELSFRDAVRGQEVELGIDGKKVKTRIPAGVVDGSKLRIAGKGRPGSNGGQAGDLVLSVHVGKHPVFKMEGRNLRMNLPVSFAEAISGAQVNVPMLEGETVTVKIPAGTPSGKVLRVKGRGIAASGKKPAGDLLLTVQIAVPTKLSKKAKAALEAFNEEVGAFDPRAELADQVRKS